MSIGGFLNRITGDNEDDVAKLRSADKELNDRSREQKKGGNDRETPEYLRLNAAANEAASKVSTWRGGYRR